MAHSSCVVIYRLLKPPRANERLKLAWFPRKIEKATKVRNIDTLLFALQNEMFSNNHTNQLSALQRENNPLYFFHK